MANELTLSASLSYAKNNITVALSVASLLANVAGNGLEALNNYVATTSDTALPLGSVTSAGGYLFIINTDPTNYVTIKSAVGGTPLTRILAGQFALFRLDNSVTVPSIQANTASCIVKYAIFDL